jgi:hypothetical protein
LGEASFSACMYINEYIFIDSYIHVYVNVHRHIYMYIYVYIYTNK